MKVVILHEQGDAGRQAAEALAAGARRVPGVDIELQAWPAAERPAAAQPGPVWESDAVILWTRRGAVGWMSCGRLEASRADPADGFARIELEAFGEAVTRGAADAAEAGYPALARERAALSQPNPEEVPEVASGPPGGHPPAPAG